MSTTRTKPAQRIVEFPGDALLDGVTVVEVDSDRIGFASDATRHTKVDPTVDLALSIPEHVAGRSANLLSAFQPGTFRGLYIGNGTVSDADIEAAATHAVEDLRLGWIHVAHSFSGHEAERLILNVDAASFARCRSLDELAAYHCNLDDDSLGELCTASRMSAMILVDTQVTADGLARASRAGLRELVYSENKVMHPHAASFGAWPGLARLMLNRVGLTDDQLGAVTALKSLVILELPGNDIFRRGFDGLAELPKLAWLDLSRTRINNTTVESIGNLQGLQRLDLSATGFSDEGLEALTGIDHLTHLYLGSCDITNDGLARIIEQHPNLAVLDISRTLITPDAVPLLTRFPNLWRLEISQEMVCHEFLDLVDEFPSLKEFGFRGGFPDDSLAIELVDYFGAANFLEVR